MIRTDLTRKHAGESYDSRCHAFDLRTALALGFPDHDFARVLRPALISATERFQVSSRAISSCVRIAMLPFCPLLGLHPRLLADGGTLAPRQFHKNFFLRLESDILRLQGFDLRLEGTNIAVKVFD